MKKDIAWNTFGNIFYGFCTWVITILVVRLGSFEDAGYLSLAMSASSTVNAIALFAMRNFQITDAAKAYSDSEYVKSRVISSLAAYLVLIVVAALSGSFYQAICMIAFMPVRLSEAVSDVFHGIDQIQGRYDLIGKSLFLRGVAIVAVFTVGALLTDNLALVLAVISCVTFAISLLFDARITSKFTNIREKAEGREIVKLYLSCLPLMLFTFFMSLQTLYAKTVLSDLLGVAKQGIYASISNPAYALQVMGAAVFAPFLPVLARKLKDSDRSGFRRVTWKVTGILIAFAAAVLVLAALLGRWVLGLFFGAKILGSYELFIPVVFVMILNTFVYWFQGVLVSLRKNVALAAGMIADFGLMALLIRPAIGSYGMNGASYAQIVALSVYILYEVIAITVTGH